MPNEIWHNFPSGNTLDAYVRRKSDDTVFDENDGGDTFEVWVDGSVTNYDIPMTDQGGDHYTVDFPSVITTIGPYRVAIALRSGANAAVGDLRVAQGEIDWSGTAEITLGTLSGQKTQVLNVYSET